MCDTTTDFCFLGQDWMKLAILGHDRTIEFHAGYGKHETIRVPKFARAIDYDQTSCDLLVTSSAHEIYRFNLEEGRFREPLVLWDSSKSKNNSDDGGATCIAISPTHALHAIGAEDGLLRFYDARTSAKDNGVFSFARLDVKTSTAGFGFYNNNPGDDIFTNKNFGEVTSVAYDSTGMFLAAGTRGGCVGLYDLRSSKPLHVKEHQYGLPIHTVQFHLGSQCVLSGDSKLIKVWRSKPAASSSSAANIFADNDDEDGTNGASSGGAIGSVVSNIEGDGGLTHFIVSGDEKDPMGHNSGLILCTSDQPKMESFYCPAIGTAPRWCSHLENITEELEDTKTLLSTSGSTSTKETFQDYKFITRDEVEELNIQNLVGTPLLRGYMHGFFINTSLYTRVRAVANPFEYEDYRKKKIRKAIEEKQQSRIAPAKKSGKKSKEVAVNAGFVQELLSKTKGNTKSSQQQRSTAKKVLEDDRFKGLFENKDFEIDEENINYLLRNPSGKAKTRADEDMDSDSDESVMGDTDEAEYSGFQRISRDETEDWDHDDDSQDQDQYDDDSESEDDDEIALAKVSLSLSFQYKCIQKYAKYSLKYYCNLVQVRGENYNSVKEKKAPKKKKTKIKKSSSGKKLRLYEANDYDSTGKSAIRIGLGDSKASEEVRKQNKTISLSLEKRLAEQETKNSKIQDRKKMLSMGDGVVNQVSYIPASKPNKKKDRNEL